MKKLKKFTLLLACIGFMSYSSFAQNESDFYTPNTGGVEKNLKTDYSVDNTFSTDDSRKLQDAIDDVARAGGGKIIIPAGNYSFSKVILKSNVRIEINRNATLRPWNVATGNYAMFTLGGNSIVENVSVTGSGGRFTVDLRHVSNERVMVFSCSNVYNFKLSDFNILDKHTVFQSIGVGHKTVNGTHYVPNKGLIKNAKATNCHYGYGLVQVQAGKNLLFKNIDGVGGVTLRLETGWVVMNKIPEPHTPKINNVYGREIKCSYGQGAVMLSPHTIDQGYVDVRGITGIGCEFAAKIDKGHVGKDKPDHLTPGKFLSSSVIANVNATYKDNATVRSHFWRFVPCNLRDKIGGETPSGEAKYCPSIAAVGYFSAGQFMGHSPTSPGSYTVKVRNVTANGFPSGVQDVITGDYCDYENCPINVWIPRQSKNTIGNCSGLRSATIDVKHKKADLANRMSVHPNPFNDKLIINLPSEHGYQTLQLIDMTGKVKYSGSINKNQNTVEIVEPVSSLDKGVYFIKLKGKSINKTLKVLKK